MDKLSQKELIQLFNEGIISSILRGGKAVTRGAAGLVGGLAKGAWQAAKTVDPEGASKLTAPFKLAGQVLGSGGKEMLGGIRSSGLELGKRLKKALEDQGLMLLDYRGNERQGVADVADIEYDKNTGKPKPGSKVGKRRYQIKDNNITINRIGRSSKV